MPHEDSGLIPTRETLLSRLRCWDNEDSWREFFDVYWKLIYNTALKSGLSDAEAQDVVQETILSVVKRMPTFQYDRQVGSFKGWLLHLTRWRIVDQFRKRPPKFNDGRDGECSPGVDLDQIADPSRNPLEQFWNEEWQKNMVDAAMQRVKRKVDPKTYQIFDLWMIHNWPVQKIARSMNVSAAQVYLAKHRVAAMIKREVNYLRKEMA